MKCGTGSYLSGLKGASSWCVGLELNPGMLERAGHKVHMIEGLALCRGSVREFPFRDESFDLVVFNQVIHHLDGEQEGAAGGWPNLRKVLGESFRTLSPQGYLVINTCSQEQVRDGFWYTTLIPGATDRLARRYIPIDALKQQLMDIGFAVVGEEVPVEATFFAPENLPGYLDPSGPLRQEWRDGDSIWALAAPEELARAGERMRGMILAGTAEDFVRQRDGRRLAVGQATFVVGQALKKGIPTPSHDSA